MDTPEETQAVESTEEKTLFKLSIPVWLDFLFTVVFIVGFLMFVRAFIFLPFSIDGESMEGNLHHGELIFVDRLMPALVGYERGDIAVLHPPSDRENKEAGLMCLLLKTKNIIFFQGKEDPCLIDASYVKRIIGIPGDRVEIQGGNVYVTPKDGKRTMASETFLLESNQGNTCVPANGCGRFMLKSEASKDFGIVPEDTYFVLGDNRIKSSDSRAESWDSPFVPKENMTGIVRAVYLSPQPRPATSGKWDWTIEFLKSLPKSFSGIRYIGDETIVL